MNQTPHAWVVAADHGRARLFTTTTPTAPLQEVQDLLNPDARLHEGQLTTDMPGRLVNSARRVGNTIDRAETAKDHAANTFAKFVCGHLERARTAGTVTRIYLVAEPEFLGLLRQHMDRETRRLVMGEVNKALTRRMPAEIRKVLPTRL